ncbi:hypothetical protein AAT19DRAFT_10383 [Rhodotorula toruloides]|uniref:Uncharacterized protein n=1 Tax=Rhodotorula toruloides TaxID=5286 RepID=A0A2T0A0J6_RHOTO|nr:hypothetical protein AAT19DRAFT_10383 [Rhodotorula toruloides]
MVPSRQNEQHRKHRRAQPNEQRKRDELGAGLAARSTRESVSSEGGSGAAARRQGRATDPCDHVCRIRGFEMSADGIWRKRKSAGAADAACLPPTSLAQPCPPPRSHAAWLARPASTAWLSPNLPAGNKRARVHPHAPRRYPPPPPRALTFVSRVVLRWRACCRMRNRTLAASEGARPNTAQPSDRAPFAREPSLRS